MKKEERTIVKGQSSVLLCEANYYYSARFHKTFGVSPEEACSPRAKGLRIVVEMLRATRVARSTTHNNNFVKYYPCVGLGWDVVAFALADGAVGMAVVAGIPVGAGAWRTGAAAGAGRAACAGTGRG